MSAAPPSCGLLLAASCRSPSSPDPRLPLLPLRRPGVRCIARRPPHRRGRQALPSFLFYTGAKDAKILNAKIANYNHPEYPELDDFGDATLVADNGATGYFRVDWFTPDGLSTWGDGRIFLLGTEGYLELRKYVDVARSPEENNVYWVDGKGEHYVNVTGNVGFPFFGEWILDCINRTENAMTQEHTLKAAELCVRAQM